MVTHLRHRQAFWTLDVESSRCARDLEALGYRYFSLDVEQNATGTVDFVCRIDGALPRAVVATMSAYALVICTEVLEHVADWGKAFANLAHLTAPGGRILITCPHFYMLHEEPHDYWRPTLHALRYYSDEAGLRVLEAKAAGTAWDILGTLVVTSAPVAVRPVLLNRLLSLGIRFLYGVTRRILVNGMCKMSFGTLT